MSWGSARALGVALRERGHFSAVEAVIVPAVVALAGQVGTARACALLGRSRATHYRQAAAAAGPVHGPVRPRPAPSNALTAQ